MRGANLNLAKGGVKLVVQQAVAEAYRQMGILTEANILATKPRRTIRFDNVPFWSRRVRLAKISRFYASALFSVSLKLVLMLSIRVYQSD